MGKATSKILNREQFIAVRDAMCAMNNVDGCVNLTIGSRFSGNTYIKVVDDRDEGIRVMERFGASIKYYEEYRTQNDFFAAYGETS